MATPRTNDGPLFGSEVSPLSPGGHRVILTSGDGPIRPKRLRKAAPVTAVTALLELEGSYARESVKGSEEATDIKPSRVMTLQVGGDIGDIGDIDTKSLESVGDEVSPLIQVDAVTGGDAPQEHEICSLEVRHFADLPLPSTLTLDVPSVGTVLVSTSRARVERERRAGALVWAPMGFELAAYAVQEGRALPSDWAGWCGRLRAPGWRLGEGEAFGGAASVEGAWRAARRANPVREPRITIGRFLRLVGARLLEVHIEDAPSAAVAAEVVW